MDKFRYIAKDSFSNAVGNDAFPLVYGSAGSRVVQLQQALRVLGETVDETNFGDQTRTALQHLGYGVGVYDQNKLNEIVLRAYNVSKKQITLTEPQMRALYEKEVPLSSRPKTATQLMLDWAKSTDKFGKLGKNPNYDKWKKKHDTGISFEDWLKRQKIKTNVLSGGQKAFDVLFGWLQMKARGVGSTTGAPSEQPVDTSTGGWFSRTDDGSIPVGYKVAGGVLIAGLAIWGISAIAKRKEKIVYVQAPKMN